MDKLQCEVVVDWSKVDGKYTYNIVADGFIGDFVSDWMPDNLSERLLVGVFAIPKEDMNYDK